MLKFWLRVIVYLFSFLISMYGLSSLDFNRLLKKNKPAQAQVLYILIAFAMSYLVGKFIIELIYYLQ